MNAPFPASRASRIHMYIPSTPLRIVGSNVWSRMYVWLLSKFMVSRLSPSLRFGSPAPCCHRPFLFPRAFLSPSPSVQLLWPSSSSPRFSSPFSIARVSGSSSVAAIGFLICCLFASLFSGSFTLMSCGSFGRFGKPVNGPRSLVGGRRRPTVKF